LVLRQEKKASRVADSASSWKLGVFWGILFVVSATGAVVGNLGRLQDEPNIHGCYEFIHGAAATFLVISVILIVLAAFFVKWRENRRRESL
jgi:hypothetical protein